MNKNNDNKIKLTFHPAEFGAMYVDPEDPETMADALARICGDSRWRQSLADSGLRYVRRFNAETFARQTMDSYLKALDAVRHL